MKKIFFLFLLALFTITTVGLAQAENTPKSKKETKKQNRQALDSLDRAKLKSFLDGHDFNFTATEIESTGRVGLSNIKLNRLWYVSVKPNMLKCFLPIYGTRDATSRPQILRNMDFTATKYEMTMEPGYRDSYIVTIKTIDSKSNTTYTMEFDVSSTGRNVRLRVNTNYDSPVTFLGDILK